MSDRSFMKLIQGGASVGYEPVGSDDGAMRIKLKKRRLKLLPVHLLGMAGPRTA